MEDKVREQINMKKTKEKNNNTDIEDIYEWESNRKEYLITIALNKDKTTSTKKGNLIKIYGILMKTGVRIESLKMVGFNKAEVKFKSRQDANKVLTESRLKPDGYTSYIPPRWKMRKGVIYEWEEEVEELEKRIAPDQGFDFTFERLKKRKKKDGKTVWEEGKAILVKVRGDSLPTKILVGWGHVWLRVEPFVEAVKQCFRCLRYGHTQATCRAAQKKCFVCTKETHGTCEENPKCMNCGEGHVSVARECQVYQREAAIKKIMAYKNVSYKAADVIVRKEEGYNMVGGKQNEDEEESDEEEWNKDFPTLRRKRKIECWEDLTSPVERELGRLRRGWENRNENTNQIQNQNKKNDQRVVRGGEERYTRKQESGYSREIGQNRGNQETREKRRDERIDRKQDNGARKRYLEREEESNTQQERTDRRDIRPDKYIEGKKGKEGKRGRNETEYLKERGEEDLIEGIVKLINDRNILDKVVRKLVENQKETQMGGEAIENEEERNGMVTQRNETSTQKKTNKSQEKVILVNRCFTDEDKIRREKKKNRKDREEMVRMEKIEEKNDKKKGKQEGREIIGEEAEEIEDRRRLRESQLKRKDKDFSEETLEEGSASEAEDWRSVTTESENTGTIEWLEDNELEQERKRDSSPESIEEKVIEDRTREICVWEETKESISSREKENQEELTDDQKQRWGQDNPKKRNKTKEKNKVIK